jgi:hypothetical protein
VRSSDSNSARAIGMATSDPAPTFIEVQVRTVDFRFLFA